MKFYYIYGETLEDVEYYDSWNSSTTRVMRGCDYDDYPTHLHSSRGWVGVMELIPEKRYENTKYLSEGRTTFNTIELDKSEVFKYEDRYYWKEFEQKLNTVVWKRYTHQEQEKPVWYDCDNWKCHYDNKFHRFFIEVGNYGKHKVHFRCEYEIECNSTSCEFIIYFYPHLYITYKTGEEGFTEDIWDADFEGCQRMTEEIQDEMYHRPATYWKQLLVETLQEECPEHYLDVIPKFLDKITVKERTL